MQHCLCPVIGRREVAEGIYVLAFHAPGISAATRAGHFLNIKVEEGSDPLLRRPFSVYHARGEEVEIVFNVIGRGTSALCKKKPGDTLDVLGPLGTPFTLDGPEFSTGVLIGGGLGVAPLPLCTRGLRDAGKSVLTFLGARTSAGVVRDHLEALHVATDDGSEGFHGTSVACMSAYLSSHRVDRPKLFACGPTAMLKATAAIARGLDIPCEVSLEGPMACGFGICQGCPVELAGTERKYALMCKEGPVFDIRRIVI